MNKKRSPLFLISLAICSILLGLLFFPRSYDVPSFTTRSTTEYWLLPTGSKIGYTKIKGDTASAKNPIIFLHGGPGGTILDKYIATLQPLAQQGYDLYFYDQIGSGHSARLDDIQEYTVKRHQQDLYAIIKTIQAEQVILLGHSWGALLAVHYLQDHPEAVERMILAGPGPILPIQSQLAAKSPPDSLSLIPPEYSNRQGNQQAYNWRSKLVLNWAYAFKSKLASDAEMDDFFSHLNNHLVKSTDCAIDPDKTVKGGGGYYNHIMTVKSFSEVPDQREKLKDLSTPLLLIRGQCDNQAWGYSNEYLSLFQHSKLVIVEGAGHDLLNRHQEKYIGAILSFLEEEN